MSVHSAVEWPGGAGHLDIEPTLRVVGGSAHRRLGGSRPGSHSDVRPVRSAVQVASDLTRHAVVLTVESSPVSHRELVVGPASKRLRRRPVASLRAPAGRLVDVAAVEWKGVDLAIKVAAVVLAIMIAAVLGVMFSGGGSISVGGHAVVQVGDSLWSVASSIPDVPSVEAAVVDIRELNGLSSDTLEAGQSLTLPRY